MGVTDLSLILMGISGRNVILMGLNVILMGFNGLSTAPFSFLMGILGRKLILIGLNVILMGLTGLSTALFCRNICFRRPPGPPTLGHLDYFLI